MAKLHPYLHFINAKEALEYYVNVFGARIIDHYPVPPSMAEQFGLVEEALENSTMHAEFGIEGTRILCSDRMGHEGEFGQMMALLIDFDTDIQEEIEKMHTLWNRVVDSGTVSIRSPLTQQFWGGWMGGLTDQYGVVWMIHAQPFSVIRQ